MRPIGIFVDTNIVNRVLAIDEVRANDSRFEKDRVSISRILKEYADTGKIILWVNPSVKHEIENTNCPEKKTLLEAQLEQFPFHTFTTTVFPILWESGPATFLTSEQGEQLENLYADNPKYRKDEKIFADAAFNSEIEILLTADRKHLAEKKFCDLVKKQGLQKEIRIMTPNELLEYLENLDWADQNSQGK